MSPNHSSSLLIDSYNHTAPPISTHHDQPTMMEIERMTQTPRTVSTDFNCLPSASALSLASTLAINAVNHPSITSVVEAVRVAPEAVAPSALTETWSPPQCPLPKVPRFPLSTSCPLTSSSTTEATTAKTNISLGPPTIASAVHWKNCLSSDVEAIRTSTASNTTLVPPMPTNPHDIAREAMRITQEAMKKQKQQEESLQKTSSSSQHHQTMSLVSLTKGTFSSTSDTNASKNGQVSGPSNTLISSSRPTTTPSTLPPSTTATSSTTPTGHVRLNKFVRRLHDMLKAEKNGGIVEWRRRGLLVLHNTRDFAKHILPKFFNTRNFKTFRRQLNYYGFVHVRSFSTTQSTTTALWVHQELAAQHAAATSSSSCSSSSLGSGENHAHHTNNNQSDSDYDDDIAAVLQLRRVEACDAPKTAEGRRHRKEQAIHTVEEDLGVNPKTLQMEHIQSLVTATSSNTGTTTTETSTAPRRVSHPEMKTKAIAALPPTTATSAVSSSTTTAAPCWKPILPKTVAPAPPTTKNTASFQRGHSLLPAVPMEISVPSPKATSSTSLVTDHETAQGAANLLLLLSKAV